MVRARTLNWWQRGVIYQIYPRSFQDSNNDGVGDLQGIIDRLDYLRGDESRGLGIDAIWISPFFKSPMADFGYDVADYCAVDPLFGDLATFDRLIAAAHARDIKVIVDYVPNHTSNQHAWFQESRSSRKNDKREWYIWKDPKPDGSPPNNWGSYFGGPAWSWDEHTKQYYMHQFVPEQPELNWRNPEVRAAMMDVLRFWLDRGVDGFRMDVVGHIYKAADFRDNPRNPNADPRLPENDIFGRLQNIYTSNQPETHEEYKAFRKLADSYGEKVLIGEVFGDPEFLARCYGLRNDELHMPFNFLLLESEWDPGKMRAIVEKMESVLPDFAWPNYVLGNHDRRRLATRYGGQAQARAAAMLLLTLRGTPTLYNGDEIGLADGRIPPHKIQDPQGVNLGADRSRDPCRTPMQWDDTLFAGFSTVEPWLPLSDDHQRRNVVVQERDPRSHLHLVQALLRLRRSSPALINGAYTTVNTPHDDSCYLFRRRFEKEEKLVAINFASSSQSLNLGSGSGRIELSTNMDREGMQSLAAVILRPNEGIILSI